MDSFEIINLTPNQWQDYKNLRLSALKNNPEAFGETYQELLQRTDKQWQTLLRYSLDGQKRWVFFAKLDNQLVGVVSGTAMESVKGGVKIREMFVTENVRKKGVATKLMQSLVMELHKNTDRRVLRLGVFKTQIDALALYKSLGFKILEEKTEHLKNGTTHESLIMEKVIS